MRWKKKKLYALMEDGDLAIFDHRVPVYWLKKVAKNEATERSFDGKVVTVELKVVK